MIDAPPVGPRRDHAGSEQCLDFRCEEQPVALPRPVKRTDPEAVAPQQQAAFAFDPKRDGKLPAQPFPHSALMLLPKVWDNFSIAVLYQAMPARLQFRPLFEVVEKLAIEDHGDVLLLVGNRLLPVREPDDTEPPHPEREPRPVEIALFIRAAMDDCAGHPADDFVRSGLRLGEMEKTGDAAHGAFLYFGFRRSGHPFLRLVQKII